MSELDVEWQDFRVTGEYTDVVNYALQRNDLPVVRRLSIEHQGAEPVEELEVAVRPADNGATEGQATAWEERIARLEPGEIWNARRVDVGFPKDELIRWSLSGPPAELSFPWSALRSTQCAGSWPPVGRRLFGLSRQG